MSTDTRALSMDNFIDRLRPFLDDDEVNEVSINRPHEVWTYSGEWKRYDIEFSYDELFRMSKAASVFSKCIGDGTIISGNLPRGERLQMTLPPACKDGQIILSIRKPSRAIITLDELERTGFFMNFGNVDFIKKLVRNGKTILTSGSTNSGKTTFINAMLQEVPLTERIVTIEGEPELRIPHRNWVSLLYKQKGVSATDQLGNAMRLNPDRVILGECRRGEALDFIRVAGTGHQGSMTSCHASSCEMALEQMALMAMERESCPPHEVVMKLIRQVVDVVIQIEKVDGRRFISEIKELR